MITIALSVLGAIASIVGIYGVYWALTTERKKLFAYEISRGLAVASASRIGGDYELSVHFKPAGGAEEKVEGAVLQYLRFANLGREAIYERDNAPGNPLKVAVSGARVLDIAIADVKRPVNRIELAPPKLSESGGSAKISFDYLDHGDGALIRVLTAGEAESIEIKGDVIGMPKGIACTSPEPGQGITFERGVAIWAVAEVVLFALTVYAFYNTLGSWAQVWLALVPIGAFILPIIAAFLIDESRSKLTRAHRQRKAYPQFRFPSEFPFGRFIFDYSRQPPERADTRSGGEVRSSNDSNGDS